MSKCQQCIYYPKCDEYPFDESGCDDFKDSSEFVEAVHGEWAIILDDNCVEYAKCSVCGEEFYDPYEDTIDITFNYCPNCGAKMDGR